MAHKVFESRVHENRKEGMKEKVTGANNLLFNNGLAVVLIPVLLLLYRYYYYYTGITITIPGIIIF